VTGEKKIEGTLGIRVAGHQKPLRREGRLGTYACLVTSKKKSEAVRGGNPERRKENAHPRLTEKTTTGKEKDIHNAGDADLTFAAR